jgi:hypothetical protein
LHRSRAVFIVPGKRVPFWSRFAACGGSPPPSMLTNHRGMRGGQS